MRRLFRAGNETRYYSRGVSEMYLCVRATLLSRSIILFEVRLMPAKQREASTCNETKLSFKYITCDSARMSIDMHNFCSDISVHPGYHEFSFDCKNQSQRLVEKYGVSLIFF